MLSNEDKEIVKDLMYTLEGIGKHIDNAQSVLFNYLANIPQDKDYMAIEALEEAVLEITDVIMELGPIEDPDGILGLSPKAEENQGGGNNDTCKNS